MKLLTIFLFFLLTTGLLAQDQDSGQWTKISSPKKDFTALIPSDFIVYNERLSHRAYATAGGATINIQIDRGFDPKTRLKEIRRFPRNTEAKYARLIIGDFIGDSYTHTDGHYSLSLDLASEKAFYRVSVSAETSVNPVLEKFLFSIRLGDKPLVKQTNPVETTFPAIQLHTLKSSPLVLKALKQKDAEKIDVVYKLDANSTISAKATSRPNVRIQYSRPIILLRRPYAQYTDAGRSRGIAGTVRLRVQFRSDGQVGDITVLRKLEGGLTKAAVEAAMKIKFIPAELAGKPVDVQQTVEYSSSIY